MFSAALTTVEVTLDTSCFRVSGQKLANGPYLIQLQTDPPHPPKKTDTPEVGAWRQRMGTPAAKELYKQRASTVETVNAECKTYRGLGPILVRGMNKVRCIALWSALAYNLMHFAKDLMA